MIRESAIAMLLAALATIVGAQNSQLPEDLDALASQLNCGPVPEFFARPGMVDPPYMYGHMPGPREDSAVFWCFREEDRSYLLVTMHNGELDSHFSWHNYPGGLSLAEQANWELSDFHFVDDPHKTGPSGVVTQYRPIQDEYDGAITLFYRHEGRWLYRMFH